MIIYIENNKFDCINENLLINILDVGVNSVPFFAKFNADLRKNQTRV